MIDLFIDTSLSYIRIALFKDNYTMKHGHLYRPARLKLQESLFHDRVNDSSRIQSESVRSPLPIRRLLPDPQDHPPSRAYIRKGIISYEL